MTLVQTERLTLVPFSFELAEAALRSRADVESLLGARVPDEWPGPDFEEVLPLVAQWLRDDPLLRDWIRIIVHTTDKTAIGGIGSGGRPDADGMIEIGYNIIPFCQRRGYGYEAVSALVDWAFRQPGLRRITANCESDNAASMRILQKAGMRQWSYEGSLLHWELTKQHYLLLKSDKE